MKKTHSTRDAFTFVEMLVAMALSAMFIGTAALALQAMGANSKRYSSLEAISLGASAYTNFYGVSGDVIRVPTAPNYGRLGYAQEMRQIFLEDVERSESVYCLARSGLNPIRPEWIDWPYADDPDNQPILDTPEAFRQFLAVVEPTSAGVFESYRHVPSAAARNTSIFLLKSTEAPEAIRVNAVYEIDYIDSTDPDGLYATVRRYKNGAMTHYYDVFFRDGEGDPFTPNVVAFERRLLLAVDEGVLIDRFKVAHGTPFYFLWLPDPSINPFEVQPLVIPTDDADPRSTYGHMASRTGFFLMVPMFPSF